MPGQKPGPCVPHRYLFNENGPSQRGRAAAGLARDNGVRAFLKRNLDEGERKSGTKGCQRREGGLGRHLLGTLEGR